MAEQEAIGLLEQLARDFNVRDPRKLFQIARREFPDRPDLTSARAAAALRGDVARQILAPKPRSLGKSAAEGPNDRLQADLVDFSQNTRGRNKYGLVVQDVFTREIATKALPDKRAETVTGGRGDHPGPGPGGGQLRGHHGPWQRVPGPRGGAARRGGAPAEGPLGPQRRPGDPDAEEGPGGHGGPEGGRLRRARGRGGGGLQCRPHQAVTVAPEDVETKPAATFRVYQDNAEKFQHNKRLTEGRQRRLQEAGAFRASTNAARSFQPQYGREGPGIFRLYGGPRHRRQRNPAQARLARAAGQRRARGPAHPAAGALGGPTASRL